MLLRIRLYELGGLGLILSMPTGVRYSNQTGGTNCLQPELEGALVPLTDEGDPGVGEEGPVDLAQ